jgi:hypothetical protein
MKFTDLFSGQRVIKQILDWLQTSKADAIEERITDVYSDGVVDGLFSNLNIVGKDLEPTLTDFFHVQVNTGAAYKNGERILLDNAFITYDTSNLTHTTDNGAGFPLSTPRSTGSFDVPLATGFINYIYIAYVQTTDDSVFTLHKITSTKQFYKRTDGYEILVNTTGLNPDPGRYLVLGTVNLTGINTAVASNISIAPRSHFRTTKLRVGIQTNNIGITDRPAVYSTGNLDLSLDDHVKSVGTGTISPINPHGLSADDLGLTESQLVRSHRRSEHQAGIIAGDVSNPAPIASGLYVQMIDVFPHGIGDYVTVKPLLGGELAVIDGLAFDNADFPTPVDIHFDTDPTGTYHIYFDSISGTVGKSTISVVGDSTKLWLSDVLWNAGTLDITSTIDHRRFGTIQRLARWYTAGRPQGSEIIRGSFGYNLTLDKLEYYNGVSWVQLP